MKPPRPSRTLHAALYAPSRVFDSIARARSALYTSGALEVVDTGIPVISIGNLTTGGTGKTPITSYLAHVFVKGGLKTGIVSRGYGGSEKGPALVPPDGSPSAASRFGDEPSWLASQHPECAVVIGAKRPEAVEFLRDEVWKLAPVDPSAEPASQSSPVVLADDAFQHRRLKRDLDIVVIDPTEPRWHYQPLPLGRMREPFAALKRAHFVFLSKTNLLPAQDLGWIRSQLRSEQTRSQFQIVEFGVKLAGVVSLERNRTRDEAAPRPLKKVALMSGIARPETFSMMVQQSARVFGSTQIVEHFIYEDHHAYTTDELRAVEEKAMALGAEALIVTEKDAIKLADWMPHLPVYVSRLIAEPLTSFEAFHEAVDRIVR